MAPPEIGFAALDVETANSNPASICQIGIATVVAGRVTDVWARFVRPRGEFSASHVAVHGIDAERVVHAPRFASLHRGIAERLPRLVVTHTGFDVVALTEACRADRLPVFKRAWIDSSVLPGLMWPERFARWPRSLALIAAELGIAFRHHDAGEDARAAAEITLACLSACRGLPDLELYARAGHRAGRRRSGD